MLQVYKPKQHLKQQNLTNVEMLH